MLAGTAQLTLVEFKKRLSEIGNPRNDHLLGRQWTEERRQVTGFRSLPVRRVEADVRVGAKSAKGLNRSRGRGASIWGLWVAES
jgi:hypothetical protein